MDQQRWHVLKNLSILLNPNIKHVVTGAYRDRGDRSRVNR